MRFFPLIFILTLTGSFIIWLYNGRKGKFNDFMTAHHNHSGKSFKRVFLGGITIGILFIVVAFTIYRVSENLEPDPDVIIKLGVEDIENLDSLLNTNERIE